MFFRISTTGTESITVVLDDGTPLSLPGDDEGYPELVVAVHEQMQRQQAGLPVDADLLRRLATPGAKVTQIVRLSDRVELRDDRLYVDAIRVRGGIVQHLKRAEAETSPILPNLVNFVTKLTANPSEVVRSELYDAVRARNLSLDYDGDILASIPLTAAGLSLDKGTAYVNSQKITGQFPNPVGAVVSMPRDRVDPDPERERSYGLHVTNETEALASSQGMIIRVKIDPADVVSIPTGSDRQQLRACGYTVVSSRILTHRIPAPAFDEDDIPLPQEPGEFDGEAFFEDEPYGLEQAA